MYRKIIILIATALFVTNCGQKVYTPLTAEATVLNEQKNKTLEVRSVGYGNSENEAIGDAERKVFELIFFRGIPNTSIEKPMVGANENSLMSQHKAYFDSFFKDRYRSFVMSSYVSSPYKRRDKVFTGTNDIKINILSLKRDLEERKVIRKFGL
ncbi:hypothetical protein IMCC3317_39670 [Kordia antarctica]|uniref:Uncharacterized protein n=1 Tax=Kordia antarctica TaxID=1218801 RepID=A0A7L4ZPD0_9FLAO|nr:hypothetical protein [Kordia antarctica]QHI38573.1 hypothetical protein IMCC3317_39670 [Kordia antarctica]